VDTARKLLASAADDVGWQVDLDQLPVTCAQVPALVLALVDASAAHHGAAASLRILDEAAASLRTVIDPDTGPDGDLQIRLLADVLILTDTRRRHAEVTRRRLLTALQALQPDGATWPPEPTAPESDGDATVFTGGLAAALAGAGLQPQPAGGHPARVTYLARRPQRTVTVTVDPDDGDSAELHVGDHTTAVLWHVTFSPGTPAAVIAAAARDALSTDPAASYEHPS